MKCKVAFGVIGLMSVRRRCVSAAGEDGLVAAPNFAQYKTYSWENGEDEDPWMRIVIKNAVNAALAAKG